MPPAGTAERRDSVFRLVLAAVAVAFALWWLITLQGTSVATNLVPVWALLTAGLFVWDALTWKLSKPATLYMIPVALFKLGPLAEKLVSGKTIRLQDCGFLLFLMFVVAMTALHYRSERSAP